MQLNQKASQIILLDLWMLSLHFLCSFYCWFAAFIDFCEACLTYNWQNWLHVFVVFWSVIEASVIHIYLKTSDLSILLLFSTVVYDCQLIVIYITNLSVEMFADLILFFITIMVYIHLQVDYGTRGSENPMRRWYSFKLVNVASLLCCRSSNSWAKKGLSFSAILFSDLWLSVVV